MSRIEITADHVCTIPKPIDSIEKVIPGTGKIVELRRNIRRSFMVCGDFPMTRLNLKSDRAVYLEVNRHTQFHYYIIHPFSKMRMRWEFVTSLLITLNLIIVPFVIAFLPRAAHSAIDNPSMAAAFLTDVLSVVDICLSFNTGYFVHSRKEIVLERRRISRRYLTTRFPFDFLASFPIEIFLYLPEPVGEEGDFPFTPYMFFGISKIFHLVTLFTYLIRILERRDEWSYGYKLFLQFIGFCYLIHFSACLKVLLARFIQGDLQAYMSQNTWVKTSEFLDHTPGRRYIMALYWTIAPCLSYRFGTELSIETEDLIFTMFLYLCGYFLKIFVTAQMLILVRNTSASKLKYQIILQQLKEFMRYKQLSYTIRQRLMEYYEFHFQKNYYKERTVMNILSNQLRQEIMLYNCRRLVINVPFFHNIPNSFLIQIVSNLEAEIYLPQDVIVTVNEPGDRMYFIASGTVAIYDANGTEVAHLHDGAHFGELVLVQESVRSATVVAIEMCELFALSKDAFLEAAEQYPEILDRIRDQARARLHAKAALRKWVTYKRNSEASISSDA